MITMKLTEISSRKTDTTAPGDLTHQLVFRQEPPATPVSPLSSLTLILTEAEAEAYDLGQLYDVATTPVTSN